MFLSIVTTFRPATDLGYLLHKHPDRVHEAELSHGRAYLFYPEATPQRCEAGLVLDIDPVSLVRRSKGGDGLQDQYVNDRPYAASSFLSVAMARMLGTAMAGKSRERPELAQSELPLEALVTPLPARGDRQFVRELFEPLGWAVAAEPILNADGSASAYVSLKLAGRGRLRDLLNHLYVLVPVLDDDKHYWVGEDEVAKLLRRGEDWLERHPGRELIVMRYLRRQRSLSQSALVRLAPQEAVHRVTGLDFPAGGGEERLEAPMRLSDQRMIAVVKALQDAGARVVADLGCGEGELLSRLVDRSWVTSLIGVDVSSRNLEYAARRLKLGDRGGAPEGRVRLLHGALTYRDRRWEEADAVTLVEVVEHIDRERLAALERIVFGLARPQTVIVTTPNREYNILYPGLAEGALRHPDHRFEWDRSDFRAWAGGIESGFGYAAALSEIGLRDPTFGAPTQMAVFKR